MWTEDALKTFGWNIQKLIDKKDLSEAESYEMFKQILTNKQPDLQQGAFLSALTSKGESPEEIAGAWRAIVEFDTNKVKNQVKGPVVENSGTGMDQLKTFNVSSAAALVAAAGNVKIARHGARALTSSCGTVDLLEALGINVECNVELVAKSIKETGIGIFNGMSPKVHPNALGRILSQIRFGSTLNIAASLASPYSPSHALRGVYSHKLIPKVSAVMKEIGFERSMVVHGFDSDKSAGMDELSNIGETAVCEVFSNGKEINYTISPEDVGLKRAKYSSIAAIGDVHKEAIRFLKVISGRDHNECIDITCFNAGTLFYLVDETKTIKDGIVKSREIIETGQAVKKLAKWVATQCDSDNNGMKTLEGLAKKAEIRI